MNLSEFIKLDTVTRAELVVERGVFVDGYLDKGLGLQIYYFEGFFVEISFNESNSIIEAIPFISGYKKEKYPVLGWLN